MALTAADMDSRSSAADGEADAPPLLMPLAAVAGLELNVGSDRG